MGVVQGGLVQVYLAHPKHSLGCDRAHELAMSEQI